MVWNDKRFRGSGKYIDRSYTVSACMYVYMQIHVILQVKPCDVCQRMNRKLDIVTPEMHPVLVKSPWHHTGIDFIGPTAYKSPAGNSYILTTSDYCTKWVEAFATPDKSAVEVCSCSYTITQCLGRGLYSLKAVDKSHEIGRVNGAHLKQYLSPMHQETDTSKQNDSSLKCSDSSESSQSQSENHSVKSSFVCSKSPVLGVDHDSLHQHRLSLDQSLYGVGRNDNEPVDSSSPIKLGGFQPMFFKDGNLLSPIIQLPEVHPEAVALSASKIKSTTVDKSAMTSFKSSQGKDCVALILDPQTDIA